MEIISRVVSARKYPCFETREAKSFVVGIWLLCSGLIGIVGIKGSSINKHLPIIFFRRQGHLALPFLCPELVFTAIYLKF